MKRALSAWFAIGRAWPLLVQPATASKLASLLGRGTSSGARGPAISAAWSLLALVVSMSVLTSAGAAQGANVQTYNDPFRYCAAVREADEPGDNYVGPIFPDAVVKVVGSPAKFRCQKGKVLACSGLNPFACERSDVSRTPSRNLIRFCRANRNASISYIQQRNMQPASAHEWACQGGVPKIVATGDVDAKGYFRESWKLIRNPTPARPAPLSASSPAPANSAGSLVSRLYPGWTLFSETDGCLPAYSNSAVSGDFNADGKMDHAVRIRNGQQGKIVAFMSGPEGHKPVVLETGSYPEILNRGLSMARSGTRIFVLDEAGEDRRPVMLKADIPLGAQCESSSYAYVISGMKVTLRFMSD